MNRMEEFSWLSATCKDTTLFAAYVHIVLSRSLPLCLEPSRSILANCQQIEWAVMLFQTFF